MARAGFLNAPFTGHQRTNHTLTLATMSSTFGVVWEISSTKINIIYLSGVGMLLQYISRLCVCNSNLYLVHFLGNATFRLDATATSHLRRVRTSSSDEEQSFGGSSLLVRFRQHAA